MSMVWVKILPCLRFDWTYVFVWGRITLNGPRAFDLNSSFFGSFFEWLMSYELVKVIFR